MSEDWFDGETAGFDAEMGEPLVIEETTTIEITEETTIEEIGTNGMSFDAIVSVLIKIFGLTMEQAIRLATRILREGIKTFFTLGAYVADWLASEKKDNRKPRSVPAKEVEESADESIEEPFSGYD